MMATYIAYLFGHLSDLVTVTIRPKMTISVPPMCTKGKDNVEVLFDGAVELSITFLESSTTSVNNAF